MPSPLEARFARAQQAFSSRRIPFDAMVGLVEGVRPESGHLVLARVDRLGQHRRLHLSTGRRTAIEEGDEILVCYGNRYAPKQYEAVVPADLGACDLVAAGGLAGRMVSKNSRMFEPTRLRPVGLVADADGHPLNLRDWGLAEVPLPEGPLPPTIAVFGTSMDSGKTATAAGLTRGLTRAGWRVGAAKVTGTGAAGDFWRLADAGARPVLDFGDVGFPSTFLLPEENVLAIHRSLLGQLCQAGVDVIVLEIADGLLQRETAMLLASPLFRDTVHRILFAASDAMGAAAGKRWLEEHDLPCAGVSGLVTASELGVREAEAAAGGPVFTLADLWDPQVSEKIITGSSPPR